MAHRNRSAPSARQQNVSVASQAEIAHAIAIHPNFVNAEVGFEELRSKDIALLRTLAGLAKAVAVKHLDDNNFRYLVKFAHDRRIISAERLGKMGKVDRTTASRWINGHSSPSTLAQEAILLKIAEDAASQANHVREVDGN